MKTQQKPLLLYLAILLALGFAVFFGAKLVLAPVDSPAPQQLAAPPFSVTTIDGRTISLASTKPIFLYFMATWCPYCRQDFEALKTVYPKYSGKMEFVAVSLDLNEDASVLASYRSKNGYPFTFAPGNSAILQAYAVRSTTTKYVIKDGKIVHRSAGILDSVQWETLLSSL